MLHDSMHGAVPPAEEEPEGEEEEEEEAAAAEPAPMEVGSEQVEGPTQNEGQDAEQAADEHVSEAAEASEAVEAAKEEEKGPEGSAEPMEEEGRVEEGVKEIVVPPKLQLLERVLVSVYGRESVDVDLAIYQITIEVGGSAAIVGLHGEEVRITCEDPSLYEQTDTIVNRVLGAVFPAKN
jgi:hypothetical protein